MIVANHAHLRPTPASGTTQIDGSSSALLRHLDFCGIDRAVVFPPFASAFNHDRVAANRWAWQETRRHPDRLIAAGNLCPTAGDALDLLEMFQSEGIRLAKVHPAVDLHDVADPVAETCYARAAELGIALDYHTGVHHARLALTEPVKFDTVAWNHPRLKMIFEHFGGRTYFEQFLAILCNHPAGKVYGGLTSVLSEETHRLWHLGVDRVMDVIHCAGAEKLIYGLDFPWNTARTNRQDIEIIRSMAIPEDQKTAILGGNLLALLNQEADRAG